ncbi:DUF3887 domain-containing protein [Pedobacter metabolipauper]|nr:DUF3887 domain-containing protein [Pedobacter metabolipauper]
MMIKLFPFNSIKKATLTIFFCLLSGFAFPQAESAISKQSFSNFKKYYNASKFDSIYGMFSSQAKTSLPFEKTNAFLHSLKSKYGNIESYNFTAYDNAFSVYRTEFEKGQLLINIAVDENNQINGLFVKPYLPETSTVSKRNTTAMHLPFKGEWTVFWGGDTKELNQHAGVEFQKNAFDIIMTNSANKSFKSNGKTNEDYYAFGQQILSPCDGEIVVAVDGIKDNIPGVANPLYIPGNSILLKTKNNEFVFLAHFKQNSIQVKQGDLVKQGQVLGLCGNSGNSSEPHLHFHLQNVDDLLQATGIKCYFEKIDVNGTTKMNYSPIKGDRIIEAKQR